jgi:hypothetical protein
MYSHKRTLNDKFTLTQRKIDLPTSAVIDAIHMRFTGTLANAGAEAAALTLADLLAKFSEMRVVSNENTVHYSLRGTDLAILNWQDTEGCSANLTTPIAIAAAGTATFAFMLTMDRGDILALTKQSVALSYEVDPAVTDDVTITALTGTVTIEENIYDSPAEFQSVYGARLEAAAEPKVISMEKDFAAADDLIEVLELPQGALNRRATMIFLDANGVRAGTIPAAVGLIHTSPDRRELFKVDYATMQELNQRMYRTGTAIPGVVTIDYGIELTCDTFGIKGWHISKGEYKIGVRSAAAGRLRYISEEYVVNTAAFDMAQRAILEATE